MADVGTVTVIRDTVNSRSFSAVAGKKMYLYSESGKLTLAVEIAPREISYDGLPLDWSTAERSGTTPLLLLKSSPLETISFEFMLTDRYDMFESQAGQFQTLKRLARTTERILVRYSGTEQGLWRLTECSASSVLRDPETSEMTRATVSVTLTRASDPAPAVGPVSRPKPPPAPPPPVRRTYTVKRGDCLWNIARRYYGGKGQLWPRIYDANRNKIKNPHLIYPGQVFVIP